MEEFRIQIRYGNQNLSFTVQRFDVTDRSEKFRIKARNKTIVLESNRPLFRNKGLKSRRPNFSLVEGEIMYNNGIQELAAAIMFIIEPPAPKKKKHTGSVNERPYNPSLKRPTHKPSDQMLIDRIKK